MLLFSLDDTFSLTCGSHQNSSVKHYFSQLNTFMGELKDPSRIRFRIRIPNTGYCISDLVLYYCRYFTRINSLAQWGGTVFGYRIVKSHSSLQKLSLKVNKLQRFVFLNSVTPYCEMSRGNCAENAVCIECERGTLRHLCNFSRNLCLILGRGFGSLWFCIRLSY